MTVAPSRTRNVRTKRVYLTWRRTARFGHASRTTRPAWPAGPHKKRGCQDRPGPDARPKPGPNRAQTQPETYSGAMSLPAAPKRPSRESQGRWGRNSAGWLYSHVGAAARLGGFVTRRRGRTRATRHPLPGFAPRVPGCGEDLEGIQRARRIEEPPPGGHGRFGLPS